MKTIILATLLTISTPTWANQACMGYSRMAEDIATMLVEGINPDNINFVDPGNPVDKGAQNSGNGLVRRIQQMLANQSTPREIRDIILQDCLNPNDVKS